MADEAQAVEAPEAPAVQTHALLEAPAERKPEAKVEVKEEPKTYTQADLDRITAKVKKNASYRARKEVEAYYKGLQQGTGLAKPPEPSPKAPEEREPARGDYETYEQFMEAKAAFVGKKAAREDRAEQDKVAKAAAEAESQAKALEAFRAKVRQKYADIEDRLDEIGHIVLPDGIGQALSESDFGPDILDHFTRNPKDCERIAALAPSAALREIGKLEARLEAAQKPAEKPKEPVASKAPEPLKPGGGAAAPDDTPKDSDDINDWMRKERARMRKSA